MGPKKYRKKLVEAVAMRVEDSHKEVGNDE